MCVPNASEHVSIWQAASLVQTVFCIKAAIPAEYLIYDHPIVFEDLNAIELFSKLSIENDFDSVKFPADVGNWDFSCLRICPQRNRIRVFLRIDMTI